MKLIDKIATAIAQKAPFYSFEFFPPKTEEGLVNLYARMDRLAQLEPTFVDITWGAGGSTRGASLEIATTAQQFLGLEVMLHLTCTGLGRREIDEVLTATKDAGIMNILALRGDQPELSEAGQSPPQEFRFAADLTRYIREAHDGYFGICVGGYPEGHVEAPNKDEDVLFLKRKVAAGADFVITQLFYDLEEYFTFVDRCRAHGITCPILPGLMPIHNYERFRRIVDLSGTKVPAAVEAALEDIKNDDEAVRAYGIESCVDMCQKLLARGVPGLHFYTLNLESSVAQILSGLKLVDDVSMKRAFPWRRSGMPQRERETVRPIFWSNRPKSYLARTMDWDDFPNGRWGDSRSPTFGDLNDYYLTRRGAKRPGSTELKLWGSPQTAADVANVFADFCRGRITRLPWCEAPLRAESQRISTDLERLNQMGFLTINSQPQINGISSTTVDVGWGGPGGFIYQKGYLEFFIAPDKVDALLQHLGDFPSITYLAVNAAGQIHSNAPADHVNAVTWGVFPGREVVQPTVVDSVSFMCWKDEAFHLWMDEWAILYDETSPSRKILKSIHDNYFLMNMVENNFVSGDVFAPFATLGDRDAGKARLEALDA